MPDLLCRLKEEKALIEYCAYIDWYLNGQYFTDCAWSQKSKNKFTKKIKAIFAGREFSYGPIDTLDFSPRTHNSKTIKVSFNDGDGVGVSFIKHIRNGIAHGKCTLIHKKSCSYVEVFDYNRKGQQTAYYYMPLYLIGEVVKIYKFVKSTEQ